MFHFLVYSSKFLQLIQFLRWQRCLKKFEIEQEKHYILSELVPLPSIPDCEENSSPKAHRKDYINVVEVKPVVEN